MSGDTLRHHRTTWVTACPSDQLSPERGVAVLLPGGAQAALFRTFDGHLYAVDNVDPATSAAVMARGIVGDRDGEPTVASPLHKQVFSLRTGQCLDDPRLWLATLPVRERDGTVAVAAPEEPPAGSGS
ncbi:nitrite reductase (NADH) small subunit [Haloactinospora alba]|uniref:Nitrite reductase (NADH) small subunit n=1 Tax=Haloactinospora alba TaxID=405555 RepID=A0A543NNN9_9ACTN|nr:nitrite reductase small subunit NirD [Haloactinospora alba]TQN33407.1 nitrite reductase (NADH) small subunit [Haloactinospora alba]